MEVHRDAIYSLLRGCSKTKDLAASRCVYSLMVSNGLDSITVLGDHVIRLFASCGSVSDANGVFCQIPKPSIYTWNAMISAHANFGEYERAIALYYQMQLKDIRPDRVTFLSLLRACRCMGALRYVRLIQGQIGPSALGSDVIIGTALVDVYAKCGSIEEARQAFDNLQNKNVISWGAMMLGYTQNGYGLSAIELFEKMQVEGIAPNRVIFLCVLKNSGSIGIIQQGEVVHEHIIRSGLETDMGVGNTLLDMYAKCGHLDEAHKVLDDLPVQNAISWGAMIAGYTRHGHFSMVMGCLETMQQQGIKPDDVIFTNILTACSHCGFLEEGHWYFKSMKEDHGIRPNIDHYSCMVDLLGRAGRLSEAIDFLQSVPIIPDIVLLTSLLSSCRTYCNVEIGRLCFHELVGLDPDDASWYVLMSKIYADAQMWRAADQVQKLKNSAGAWKKAGRAWIEVQNKMHEFVVRSENHLQEKVHLKLQRLSRLAKSKGHMPVLEPLVDEDFSERVCAAT